LAFSLIYLFLSLEYLSVASFSIGWDFSLVVTSARVTNIFTKICVVPTALPGKNEAGESAL